MSQTISYLRGQAATVEALNAATSAATDAGLKKKVTFIVSATTANVSAHIGIFGCGVALIEDSAIALDTTKYFSTGMSAFAGTLCYRLDSALYTRPVLTIETGILAVASDPLLLVIGWVNYPGGNVALAAAHFKSAPVGSIAFSLPIPTTSGYLYYDQATDSFAWQEIAEADTYKFKVNDTDPLPGYMADKIADTSDVSLSINAVTRKLEAKLLVDIPAPDDHMLLASSADQTPGYLVSKIADTPSIKLDINSNNKLEATFLGSISGDHLVYADVDDATPGNLMAKLVSGNDKYLTINKKPGTTSGGAVNDQVSFTIIGAPPTGIVGGIDLTGAYADTLVIKQITGVGAGLVAGSAPFQFKASSYGTPNGGRGIGSGYHYVTVNGVQVHKRCWIAQGEKGDMYISNDNWGTYIEDDHLQLPFSYTAYGSSTILTSSSERWNCLRYGYVGGTIASYCWIAGGSTTGAYVYPDIPTNWAVDGTMTTNWIFISYGSQISNPSNFGDAGVHDTVCCFLGNDRYIGRTTDFQTFTQVKDSSGTVIQTGSATGGIDTDHYGNWLAVERDTGILLVSQAASTGTESNDGLVWSKLTGLTIYASDGTKYTNQSSLRRPYNESFGNVACAYGLWVLAVWSGSAGHYNYVYSDDMITWYEYTDTSALASAVFYSAAFDGIRWYGTNPESLTTPALYTLLVSAIPVHKELVCEAGLAVAGNTFLADFPNIDAIGTDENGKLGIGVGGSDASFTAGQATNILTKKSGNLVISDTGATVTLATTLISRAIRIVSSVAYTIIVPVGTTFTCSGIVYDAALAEKHVSVPSGYVLQLFQTAATAWFGTTNATLVIAS